MSIFHDKQRLYEDDYFFIIRDGYPVSPGHLLVVSKLEKPDYFSLSKEEKANMHIAIEAAKRICDGMNPTGYNIGMNCGVSAGQTVQHFHCHVIPRYDGDMEDPSGGVRHVIPSKGNYKKKGN